MNRALSWILLLASGCLSACADEPGHLLRFRFEEGQKARLETETRTTIQIQGGEADEGFLSWEVDAEVLDVVDGDAHIQSVTRRMKGRFGDVVFDSGGDPASDDDSSFEAALGMLGTTMNSVVSPRGAVSRASVPAELTAALAKLVPGVTPGQLAAPNICRFPEGEIRVGETWSSSLEIPMEGVGAVSIVLSYELTAVEGSRVFVELSGFLDLSLAMSMALSVANLKFEPAPVKGELIADLASGFVEHSEVTVTMISADEEGTELARMQQLYRVTWVDR